MLASFLSRLSGKAFCTVGIALFFTSTDIAAQDREVSVTVYPNGLGLIRDMRTLEIAKGRSNLTFSRIARQINPTSVRVRSLTTPEQVSVLEQRFQHDPITSETLLARHAGQPVELWVEDSDTPVKGRLLETDGDVTLQEDGGRIHIIRRDTIRRFTVPGLPPGMGQEPTLFWMVDNTGNGGIHRLETGYLTSGMNWHAEYTAVINQTDNAMLFSGWASIDNRSGMTYDNAAITLVAGDVHQVSKAQPMAMMRTTMADMAMEGAAQFQEQRLFEYHSYTLDRRGTISDNGVVQLSLFPDTRTQATSQYVYDGGMQPDGVQTRLRLENKKTTGLGRAIPRGTVRIYQEDKQGRRQFVGEDRIKDLAVDETAYLTVGRAFDIIGERTQTDSRVLTKRSREESWEIVLRNHKKEAVAVRVVEHLQGPGWSIPRSSQKYEKLDAQTIEFTAQVPADGETTVTYSVTYRW